MASCANLFPQPDILPPHFCVRRGCDGEAVCETHALRATWCGCSGALGTMWHGTDVASLCELPAGVFGSPFTVSIVVEAALAAFHLSLLCAIYGDACCPARRVWRAKPRYGLQPRQLLTFLSWVGLLVAICPVRRPWSVPRKSVRPALTDRCALCMWLCGCAGGPLLFLLVHPPHIRVVA